MKKHRFFESIHKRIFILLFVVILAIISAYLLNNSKREDKSKKEEKIISNVELQDNFTDDIVLVLLTKKESLKFLKYTTKDFPGLDLSSVKALNEYSSKQVKKIIENGGKIDEDCTIDPNYVKEYRLSLSLKLSKPSKQRVIEYIRILEKREDVYSAEPNYLGTFSSTTPNDVYFNEQWAINNLRLPYAWDITKGANPIKVGIIDSGIDIYHSDLANKVNFELSRDFSGNNCPWAEKNYHGTHVAGIVGANGNDGNGVVGVNWQVELVSLKVGDLEPSPNAVAQAIEYAESINLKILNLSLNIKENNSLQNAINSFNGIIVCSSGNLGNNNVSFPARLNNPKIISVGSLNSNNHRSTFSCYGKVDIWAPGSNILNAVPDIHCFDNNITFMDGTRLCEFKIEEMYALKNLVLSDQFTWEEIITNFEQIFGHRPNDYAVSKHEGEGYHYLSGTSMAAPHVTGAIALLLSINPNIPIQQIKECIYNGAKNICITLPSGEPKIVKKLDVYASVKKVLENHSSLVNLRINTQEHNKYIDSLSPFYNNKNYFLKLNVQRMYEYEFTISSTSEFLVKLYDSSFNEMSFSLLPSSSLLIKNIKQNLFKGIYYLKISYINNTFSGTINVSIAGEEHYSHNWGPPYITLPTSLSGIKRHKETCSVCEEERVRPCFGVPNESSYCTYCVSCGQLLSSGEFPYNRDELHEEMPKQINLMLFNYFQKLFNENYTFEKFQLFLNCNLYYSIDRKKFLKETLN